MGTIFIPYLLRLDKEERHEGLAIQLEKCTRTEEVAQLCRGISAGFIYSADNAVYHNDHSGTVYFMLVAYASYAVWVESLSNLYNYPWAAYESVLDRYASQEYSNISGVPLDKLLATKADLVMLVKELEGIDNAGR